MKSLIILLAFLSFTCSALAGNVVTSFPVAVVGDITVGTTTDVSANPGRSVDNTTWSYAIKVQGTPISDGVLTSISIYAKGYSDGRRFKLSLYTHDSANDLPASLIASSTTVEGLLTTNMTLYTLAVASGTPSIINGTQYWIVYEQLDGYNTLGSSGYVGAGAWAESIKVQAGAYNWPAWGGTEDGNQMDYEVTAFYTYTPN